MPGTAAIEAPVLMTALTAAINVGLVPFPPDSTPGRAEHKQNLARISLLLQSALSALRSRPETAASSQPLLPRGQRSSHNLKLIWPQVHQRWTHGAAHQSDHIHHRFHGRYLVAFAASAQDIER